MFGNGLAVCARQTQQGPGGTAEVMAPQSRKPRLIDLRHRRRNVLPAGERKRIGDSDSIGPPELGNPSFEQMLDDLQYTKGDVLRKLFYTRQRVSRDVIHDAAD